jgi:hypothetical protein
MDQTREVKGNLENNYINHGHIEFNGVWILGTKNIKRISAFGNFLEWTFDL